MSTTVIPPLAFATAGQALGYLRLYYQYVYLYAAGGSYIYSIDVGFRDGLGCLHQEYTETFSGDTSTQDILILNVSEGSEASAPLFIGQAGFDGQATAQADSTASSGEATAHDVAEAFGEILINLKMDMVDAFTDANTDEKLVRIFAVVGSHLVQSTGVFWCINPGGSCVSREQLIVGDGGGEVPSDAFQPAPFQAGLDSSASVLVIDSQGIITALTDLAMQRQEISFNHGNVIFSIDGRIISGV